MDDSKIISEEVNELSIEELGGELLNNLNMSGNTQDSMSLPIAEIATLGAGVSSLIPAFNTVTNQLSFNTNGLYTVANLGVKDALKVSNDNTYWGAIKTHDGLSKMARLKEAGPITATGKTISPVNPAMIMMAVALYSIERELGKIAEMEKAIISFLEIEKESEIEADVKMLMSMVNKYKHNWDNDQFISSNHKMVLDIQRTALKNTVAFQKKVTDIISSKQFLIAKNKVASTLNDLEKKFNYYRLSLYSFSLSSLMEIMLSGNFKEEYILGIKTEIKKMSDEYRDLFSKSSIYLEKISGSSIENNVLKGIGTAGKAVGGFIGSIPYIKEGQVDEFLQDKGSKLKDSTVKKEKDLLKSFSSISSPETAVFLNKMDDMIKIYNHTEKICIDKNNVYLLG